MKPIVFHIIDRDSYKRIVADEFEFFAKKISKEQGRIELKIKENSYKVLIDDINFKSILCKVYSETLEEQQATHIIDIFPIILFERLKSQKIKEIVFNTDCANGDFLIKLISKKDICEYCTIAVLDFIECGVR